MPDHLSSYLSNKTKLAPRSSQQFKVGPQFSKTVNDIPIFSSSGKKLAPVITPRIDRGFEKVCDEWIGYKRNYFTLVCSFHFMNHNFQEFLRDTYYSIDPCTGKRIEIKYFGLRIVSKCADDDSDVSLVQHTAKRDRGPQTKPSEFPAVPSELPDHEIIRDSANVRNISKIAKLEQVFFYDKDNQFMGLEKPALKNYPDSRITKVARYERIQFSSSVNNKKPLSNNKKFKLYVELTANIGNLGFITLAFTETPPLVIRGRSPSNYCHQTASDFQEASKSSTEESLQPKRKKKDDQITPKRKSQKEIPTKISEPKSSSMEILNIIDNEDKSLNDQDTYEILLNANKHLDYLAISNFSNILATSTPSQKPENERKGKHLNESLRNTLLKKLKKAKQTTKSKTDKNIIINSPTQKSKILKEKKKLSDTQNKKKVKGTKGKNQKIQFPSPTDFELDNFDFDSSIGDIELIDSRAKKSLSITNSFRKENNDRSYDYANHDFELMKVKSKLSQSSSDLVDFFSRLHESNPSEILKSEFDDGPSFIVC